MERDARLCAEEQLAVARAHNSVLEAEVSVYNGCMYWIGDEECAGAEAQLLAAVRAHNSVHVDS